jgi:hypothetical protein
VRPALLALALVAAAAAPARADQVPSGRMSLIGGLRTGTGSLDDAFGLGGLYGVEAAWEPLPDGQKLGYAVVWGLLRGDFGSDPAAITGELDILEMSLGARLRFAPKVPTQSVFLGGGGAVLRANTPLPPDQRRDYVGGYLGGGVELKLWKLMTTLEGRYGLLGAGPGSFSVQVGVGFGV